VPFPRPTRPAQVPPRRADLGAVRHHLEHTVARFIILETVDNRPLPRARDVREHRDRPLVQERARLVFRDERERQEIAVAPAVRVFERRHREERRVSALPQPRPIGEPRPPDVASLRRKPPLSPQERNKGPLFENRSRAAVEHTLPVGPHQQREQPVDGWRDQARGVGSHNRCPWRTAGSKRT
jgi:hypothetical protein